MRPVAARLSTPPVVGFAVDVAVGAATLSLDTLASLAGRAAPVLGPVTRTVLRPPGLPAPLQPAHWLDTIARRGFLQRRAAAHEVRQLLDALVPVVLDEVLRRADLTGLVLTYVDLDGVVEAVDLDAAVSRVDLDAAVSRVDLDAVAERLDVDAVAGRLDLNAVARGLDLDEVLDRLDLTELVLKRVDLDLLVREVLDHLDPAMVTALATEVIDAVNLPEIIRESTGSMASETVMGARMQGIAADETVARIRDRLLLRRGHGPDAPPLTGRPVDDPSS